jgi:SAM-dependent methyltransferase
MPLSNKYDEFYRSTLQKETLPEIMVSGWPHDRVQAIVAMGGAGGTILDIGCGNGYLLYQFRDKFSALIGLEYSPMRLEQAKINLAGFNFIGLSGSAENMSQLEDDSVDRIISADTIEHIPDIYSAVREMYRVLKPEGVMVINTPNIAFIKKRVLLSLGRFPSTSQPNEGIGDDIMFDGGHLHYFTYRSLRIVLERAGFEMIKRVGYGKLGWVHHAWPSLLSVGVQWVVKKRAGKI